MDTEWIQGACPHDCPDSCAWQVQVKDGVAVHMRGDANHPSTSGALCTKVSRYPERSYHPDRLTQPLKRVGPKGQGRWEAVSWDEALDGIASRLGEIARRDPQAVVPYSYAGTMGLVQGEAMASRFFHAMGASRLDRTICATAGAEALAATYGGKLGMSVSDFAHSRLIVIWGSNSITSNLHFWSIAMQAKRDGAQLVCIDPRKTETAERCHVHLALRPGTDAVLALAIMQIWIRDHWLDADYIEQHTEGWPALREEALRWTTERASLICGLDPEQIEQLARDMGAQRATGIRLNYGMQRVRGGGDAVRLIAMLPCLTGAWKVRGGGLLLSSSGWAAPWVNEQALKRPDLLAGREPRTLNMSTLAQWLTKESSTDWGPRVEALVVYNSNPAVVAPQSLEVLKGLQREDLFVVVLEHFMTDTADWADYVLPATTQLEHWDVHTSYGHTDVLLNRPAIEPVGQARPNSRIFADLARRMAYTDPCFDDSDEDLCRMAFRDWGGLHALWEKGWAALPVPPMPFAQGGFPTSSGKAMLSHPQWGVPRFHAPYESALSSPALADRYPLAMVTPPARNFLNSTFVNVDSLQPKSKGPTLEMHRDDAKVRGLADGDPVRVFNDRGQWLARLQCNDRARPGVVFGMGLWWRKLSPGGLGVNDLTHTGLTDIGRAPCFYDCLVQVERAEDTLSSAMSSTSA